jgi:hypothetical protein
MRLVAYFLRVALLATMLLLASATQALTSVPDAAHSYHDPCLIVCPFGDQAFTVIVRDIAPIGRQCVGRSTSRSALRSARVTRAGMWLSPLTR